MNTHDITYLTGLNYVYQCGELRTDRTGTGTKSVLDLHKVYPFSAGFPLLTSKKVHWKSVVGELLWMLSGSTSNTELEEKYGVSIWREFELPYSTQNRNIVLVATRKKEYQPLIYPRVEILGSLNEQDSALYAIWNKIMSRCYDTSAHNYRFYGAVGVSVSKEWQDPNIFIKEVKMLPYWKDKEANWKTFNLDKDYYGSKQYGKDTCVWLSEEENIRYNKTAKVVQVCSPTGDKNIYLSASEASEKTGMSMSSLFRLLKNGPPTIRKGKNKSFVGWDFQEVDPPEGYNFRLELKNGDLGLIYGAQWRNFGGAVDQITALEQNLRSDPFSRRHIVSAWNPMDLGKQSLPACHTMFQAYVQNDGSLWLKLFQRSGDMFLGVPFNIASYSLLCAMLAHTTGLKPGGLIHTITDAHIYNDHMNAVREQLARMEGCPDSPSIELNPNVTSILDFTPDDIKLLNYNPLSTIKAKVSV